METNSNRKQYIFLILIYAALFLPLAFLRFPDARNELKYFIVAQDMIESKNYLILKYFSELYPDKPPLYFWILIFFKNNFKNYFYPLTLIFGSLLPSLGTVLLNFRLLTKLNKPKAAFISSIFLMTVPYFTGVSLFLRMDVLMGFFIMTALYLFFTRYYNVSTPSFTKLIVMYLAVALAVLTKGGAGIAVPLLVILSFLILEKNTAFLREIHFFKGIILVAAVLGLWLYAVSLQPQGREYISLMLGQETIGRVVQAKTHSKPFYFYISRLPMTLYPYGVIFIGALIYYLRKIKEFSQWSIEEKIGFSWSFIPLIFFSFVSGKLDIYLIPLYSGMVLLSCSYLERKTKYGNYLLKITSALIVIPLLLELFFNRWKNLNRSIIYITGTIFVFYLSFPFALPYYNSQFSLKKVEETLKADGESSVIAYRFPDFLNISYEIGKDITPITERKNIEALPSDEKFLIVSREKYHKDIDDLENLMLIYNNKAYYIYQKR